VVHDNHCREEKDHRDVVDDDKPRCKQAERVDTKEGGCGTNNEGHGGGEGREEHSQGRFSVTVRQPVPKGWVLVMSCGLPCVEKDENVICANT